MSRRKPPRVTSARWALLNVTRRQAEQSDGSALSILLAVCGRGAVELPRLDSGCFQLFLDHFSQQYAESLNVLVLDNAPAHIAKALVVPDNLVLIFLPPYCPELNPVERLWQDLKGRLVQLAADVRQSLSKLREQTEKIICTYSLQQLASLTGYPYLCQINLH